jgi:hypothetical protein
MSPAFYVHYIIATCCGRICLAVFFSGGMWLLGSAGEGVSVRRELALLQLQDVRRRARRLLQLLRRRAQPCPGLESKAVDFIPEPDAAAASQGGGRGGRARISLPDLPADAHGREEAIGELTWPVRFALWGLGPLAQEFDVELDELRLHLDLQGAPQPIVFRIHQAAEDGVVQTLQDDALLGAPLSGGPFACRLRVFAHVDGDLGQQLSLPLESSTFLLRVPEGGAGACRGAGPACTR